MTTLRKLFGVERRIDRRYSVDFRTSAQRGTGRVIDLYMVNLSARGFMCEGTCEAGRGDTLIVDLPVVQRRPARLTWLFDGRFGGEFLSPISDPEFADLLVALGARSL